MTADNFNKRKHRLQRSTDNLTNQIGFVTPETTLRNTGI